MLNKNAVFVFLFIVFNFKGLKKQSYISKVNKVLTIIQNCPTLLVVITCKKVGQMF